MIFGKITQNIELRLIDRPQSEPLFRLIDSNREHLRRWHPWVDLMRSTGDVNKAISVWQLQHAKNLGFCAGIWFNETLCGIINHLNVDWLNRSTSLSYWLAASHQGKGIMTECCRAFINHAFDTWRLNRISIGCASDNVRSRAIPERLGFNFEGIIRGVEWLHDHYVDHAVYGLLRSEARLNPAMPAKDPRANFHPATVSVGPAMSRLS